METPKKEDIEKVFQQEVTEADLKKAYKKSDKVIKKVEGGFLRREINKIKILIKMLKDYVERNYREVPWGTIATLVIILLYILSPFDLIPDWIPVIGQLDDFAVLSLGWQLIGEDIRTYASWKIRQGDSEMEELAKIVFG